MAENNWHRYGMKKLRHCHHMHSSWRCRVTQQNNRVIVRQKDARMPNISQRSVAALYLRCGGIFTDVVVTNLLLSLDWKYFGNRSTLVEVLETTIVLIVIQSRAILPVSSTDESLRVTTSTCNTTCSHHENVRWEKPEKKNNMNAQNIIVLHSR